MWASVSAWLFVLGLFFFFFKQKTAYEMRISDWSSDVCSSDLQHVRPGLRPEGQHHVGTLAQCRRQTVGTADHETDGVAPAVTPAPEDIGEGLAGERLAALVQRHHHRAVRNARRDQFRLDRNSTRLNSSH